MIKLIATDMDGTLLDENGELPEGFIEILDRVREKNIKLVIASGRPYYTLQTNFGPVGRYLSFICENGALVVDNNKIIYACLFWILIIFIFFITLQICAIINNV